MSVMDDDDKKLLKFYSNMMEQSKLIPKEAFASILITTLGQLPLSMDEEFREEIIIIQASAIIAEGIVTVGLFDLLRNEECLKTADELNPYIKEALQKYKASKIIKMNS